MIEVIAKRTSYFYLARKLIWPLWSSHNGDDLSYSARTMFPKQHKNGESPPNSLFLGIFQAGQAYFLSAPFIAADHNTMRRAI